MVFASNWSLLGQVSTRHVNGFWSGHTKGGRLNVCGLIWKTRDSLKTFLMARPCEGTSVPLHQDSVSIHSLRANLFIDQIHKILIALLSVSLETFSHVRAKCSLIISTFSVPVRIECEVMKASEKQQNKSSVNRTGKNKQRSDRHWIKRTGSRGTAKWEVWTFRVKERLRSFLGRVQHHLDSLQPPVYLLNGAERSVSLNRFSRLSCLRQEESPKRTWRLATRRPRPNNLLCLHLAKIFRRLDRRPLPMHCGRNVWVETWSARN